MRSPSPLTPPSPAPPPQPPLAAKKTLWSEEALAQVGRVRRQRGGRRMRSERGMVFVD